MFFFIFYGLLCFFTYLFWLYCSQSFKQKTSAKNLVLTNAKKVGGVYTLLYFYGFYCEKWNTA